MLGEKLVDEVYQEWLTGRAPGGDSSKVARFNREEGSGLLRQRVCDVEDLGSELCRRAGDQASHVRVRIATGADGEPEVRVEVESDGEIRAYRRRPASLAGLRQGERWLVTEHAPAARAARASAVAAARRAISETASLAETQPALQAIKARSYELADMIEAGSEDALAEMALLAAHAAPLRARHDQHHRERKGATMLGQGLYAAFHPPDERAAVDDAIAADVAAAPAAPLTASVEKV